MDPAFKHLQFLRGSNLVKETENNMTQGCLQEITEAVQCSLTLQAGLSAELNQVINRKPPKIVNWLGAALHSWE